jgi:hypothetical protein
MTPAAFALEHACYPVLLPLVLGYGLAAGRVRHRAGSVAVTTPMHVLVDLRLLLAAAAARYPRDLARWGPGPRRSGR